jgi:hypothetical protein
LGHEIHRFYAGIGEAGKAREKPNDWIAGKRFCEVPTEAEVSRPFEFSRGFCDGEPSFAIGVRSEDDWTKDTCLAEPAEVISSFGQCVFAISNRSFKARPSPPPPTNLSFVAKLGFPV